MSDILTNGFNATSRFSLLKKEFIPLLLPPHPYLCVAIIEVGNKTKMYNGKRQVILWLKLVQVKEFLETLN